MGKFFLHLNTKIYFGNGEINKIASVLKDYGKVLLVIGGGSVKKNGILPKIQQILDAKNIQHILAEGIEPNPRARTIDKIAHIAKQNNVEAVVAIGGGSVMDASKLIAVVAKQGNNAWDYARLAPKPIKIKEALPIITVPTLSATGSETNMGAVVSNQETGEKYPVHSRHILPIASVIDPELTKSVPIPYVVDGAIDIITHSLETYLSNTEDNSIADQITLAISRTVKLAVETILKNKTEELAKARENLSWSASIAINGILNIRTGPWPIHAVEHVISGIYDISHGAGLSFLLPPFLEYNLNTNSIKVAKFLGYFLHGNIKQYLNNPEQGIADFVNWQKTVGAGSSSKLDIKNIDIKRVIELINNMPSPNLEMLDNTNLVKILEKTKTSPLA